MDKAYFAGGCFWCTEAIFERLRGVEGVVSGYTGGEMEHASYKEVKTGSTSHAETIEIVFNPKKITYEELLYVFFKTHDPTSINKQGADIGPQYRSSIFYTTNKQKALALKAREEFQLEYSSPIVTQISEFQTFYPAEHEHQDFYKNNKNSRYCRLVIDPKIKKLQEDFGEYLK